MGLFNYQTWDNIKIFDHPKEIDDTLPNEEYILDSYLHNYTVFYGSGYIVPLSFTYSSGTLLY